MNRDHDRFIRTYNHVAAIGQLLLLTFTSILVHLMAQCFASFHNIPQVHATIRLEKNYFHNRNVNCSSRVKILIPGIRGGDASKSAHYEATVATQQVPTVVRGHSPPDRGSLNRFSELMELISGDFVPINLFNDPLLILFHPYTPFHRIYAPLKILLSLVLMVSYA